MRIALVSPLYEVVPPPQYGGTERVIAALANELCARGHDVTLFAAAGSATRAKLVECAEGALRLQMSRHELEQVAPHLHLKMLRDVYQRANDFDIIHAHTDIWTLPFLAGETRGVGAHRGQTGPPTVITMHGRLDIDVAQQVLPLYPQAPLVSISKSQRAPLLNHALNWVGTCYNGLDLSAYSRSGNTNREYLAFVGRITAEKRPEWAIEVAARAGMPLRIAAKIDPIERDHWSNVIEPLLARCTDVDFVGEISEIDKPEFFGNAAATLFPIDWPEPFGLVMIESLAAGTPVIALNNGAVPEVLEHGRSGFICHNLDQMVAAVGQSSVLSAQECRAEARRFSAEAMTDQYLDVYQRLLRASPGKKLLAAS